jgi:hypothetical protein
MPSEHNRFEQAKTRGEAEPAQEDFTQQIQAVPEIASSLVATHVPHDLTKAHPRLILGKQDDIIREHSFQLVGLQNQIQEIQNARDEEAAGKADLLDELRRLREDMTYLKGKLAGLTVEVHSQHPEAKTCRTFKKDSEFQFGQSCHGSSPHRTDMVASESEVWPPPWGESDVTTVAEKVAEQLLLEQRTLLVKGLVSIILIHGGPAGVLTVASTSLPG